MERLKQQLQAEGIAYRADEPLAAHCTFKIGGPADVFALPETEEQLCRVIAICKEQGVKYYLLGNGSNILFEDAGYRGVVIETMALKMGIGFLEQVAHPGAAPGEVYDAVVAGAGLKLSSLCTGAKFHLKRGDPDAIKARMNELMAKRVEKQPLDKPSAGSTFKRPAGAFAAALIDQCGLRGFRHGGAAVSEKHCGFVVNLGGATCADVLALCDEVRAIVKEKTGFDLEKEIRVVKA